MVDLSKFFYHHGLCIPELKRTGEDEQKQERKEEKKVLKKYFFQRKMNVIQEKPTLLAIFK